MMYEHTYSEGLFYPLHVLYNHQILNEDGFVGDVRTQSSDIQEILDTYDTPRLVNGWRSKCL